MINTIKTQNTGISAIITALNDRPLRKHLIIYFCEIENDNTYAKSCMLHSKDVYINVTQSKNMCVCVCVRAPAHGRACACARACVCVCVCVCQQLRQVRETFWSIQMCTLVFVLVVVEFSARVHPFRIC